MEVVRLVDSVLRRVETVRSMVIEDKARRVRLKSGLEAIKSEMGMLSSEVRTIYEESSHVKPEEWILQLQDLAYDIEDFIDRRGQERGKSAPVRLVEVAMVTDPRPEHLLRIDHFKDRIRGIRASRESLARTRGTTTQPQAAAAAAAAAAGADPLAPGTSASPPAPSRRYTASASPVQPADQQLVGVEAPKGELAELLSAAGGHQSQLKVISIVGCSGLGKTTLARALYKDASVVDQFPLRAWVEASSPTQAQAGSILHSILQQVAGSDDHQAGQTTSASEVWHLKIHLKQALHSNRYLVMIDDVQQREVWQDICDAFPEEEQGSRVVITTNDHSLAKGFSSGSYLYTMRRLCSRDSADLFWTRLGRGNDRPPALVDGLQMRWLTVCAREHGDALGNHLASEESVFAEAREALARCCHGLHEQGHQMCMLSVCSFPRGHRINRKSLIRRWIAEGLVVGDVQLSEDQVACNCMTRLADLGIIEPVPRRSRCSKVKRGEVHGVMLDFLVHRSVSWNFIALVVDERRVVRNHGTTCAVRRLSVHGAGGAVDVDRAVERNSMSLSSIRSLTVCNTDSRMSLGGCRLLRVLDLEGCGWLHNGVLQDICRLLHLKYLSIRDTKVSKVPSAVRHLHCLETLDMRDTGIAKLPMEVLTLPRLAHLFGKFELPAQLGDPKRADKLRKFFSEESALETLAGFIIVNDPGFEQILRHAKMLRKVKIWCNPGANSASASNSTKFIANLWTKKRDSDASQLPATLSSSLQARFTGAHALNSVYVDFAGLCRDFLVTVIKDPCGVSSIKIRGQMASLPESPTLRKLRNIKELHLCDTGLPSDGLSVLQSLECLESLKLGEIRQGFWDGGFVVEKDGFPSLQQLCFEGPKLPKVAFQGANCSLISLQLICPELATSDIGEIGITHLQHLDEVILHPQISDQKMQAWKDDAIKHKNRPYVKRQQRNHAA
ncbi:hypothetical protein ACP4OV_027038 [Aristida adscensionis]